MLAHYHGQTWNAAELARAVGVSQPTVVHAGSQSFPLDEQIDAVPARDLLAGDSAALV